VIDWRQGFAGGGCPQGGFSSELTGARDGGKFQLLKVQDFIIPACCLIGVVAWGLAQRRSIQEIERQSAALEKRIQVIRASGGGSSAHEAGGGERQGTPSKRMPEWSKIATRWVHTGENGMGDVRSMMRLQAQLQEMSCEELLTAMDEVAALDLPSEARIRLEQMIIGAVLSQNPELGLSRFIDRLEGEDTGLTWQMSNALKEWAKKDPLKASAWFDREIAAGRFESKALDGKNPNRIQFEGAVISVLLSSDPVGAGRRLAEVEEDQRSEVLGGYSFHVLKDQEQVAYVGLVRGQLPERDQATVIAQLASRLVSTGDYEKVTAYLDRIEATPEERKASVERAAESKIQVLGYNGGVTREAIDSMRAWVSTQSPEWTASVTGKTLARAVQHPKGMKFAEAAALAEQYGQAGGNDEVLASFLEQQGSAARSHQEEARALAAKITDEKRRERILRRLE
jgi:hypothetical protein